jgi:hypothetical protein
VLARALTRVPQAIEWIEPEIENVPAKKQEGDATGLVTH